MPVFDYKQPKVNRSAAQSLRPKVVGGEVNQNVHVDNHPRAIQQRKVLAEMTAQRTPVIQRHPTDDDVLNGDNLELVIKRLEAIAEGDDKREPLQARITDLWLAQNRLFNLIRSNLELLSAQKGEQSTASAGVLQGEVGKFSVRLAAVKVALFTFGIYEEPETEIYESQVGTHLRGGGGGNDDYEK